MKVRTKSNADATARLQLTALFRSFFIFFSASIIVFSFYIFDHENVKELLGRNASVVEYTLLLALAVAMFLLAVITGKGRVRYTLVALAGASWFYFALLWGVAIALFFGIHNLNALIALCSFLIVVLSFFLAGAVASREIAASFGSWFLGLASLFFLISFMDTEVNRNWVALSLLFSFFCFFLARPSANGRTTLLALGIIFFLSILFLGARGVALSAIFVIVFSVFLYGFGRRATNEVRFLSVFGVIASALPVSVMGARFYNSNWYHSANKLSIENTGKSLDSSRLQRWDAALSEYTNLLLGGGLDATVARVSVLDYGALHNLPIETFFRLGMFGWLVFSLVLAILVCSSLRSANKAIAYWRTGIAAGLIPLGLVYGIGGFTHWPATAIFWFVLGLLVNRNLQLRYNN